MGGWKPILLKSFKNMDWCFDIVLHKMMIFDPITKGISNYSILASSATQNYFDSNLVRQPLFTVLG
jgi:hypothetical protein